MSIWMFTAPSYTKRIIERTIYELDSHKWIIAREVGEDGYRHLQGRIHVSDSNDQELFRRASLHGIHVEQSPGRWDDRYERKGGYYWTSDDRIDTLRQRFGNDRQAQRRVQRALDGTNDREVILWYDVTGNAGKSWLIGALWERGGAYFTYDCESASGMVKDIANEYIENGWRPYVVIDMPRNQKWTQSLYLAIERIKDGLIKDPRYGSRSINIRGVKVLVCSNTKPKFDKLSEDRWVVLGANGLPLL